MFASGISYLIRLYSWHRYKVWIDIQALQVSLLAGRVFFTGFRYHGNNESILIQNGHITWSYWLWRVKDVDLGLPVDTKTSEQGDAETAAEAKSRSARLPCRINIAVSGLEWFIYNRSPVYESILAGMVDNTVNIDEGGTENADRDTNQPRQRLQKASQKIEEQLNKLDSRISEKKDSDGSKEEKNVPDGHRARPAPWSSLSDDEDTKLDNRDMPLMLQLLPIHFECEKAAIVVGNENTKAILIVKTNSLSGEIDASGCETPDPYRQLFKVRFNHPIIEMRDHEGYKEDQLTQAVKDKQAVLGNSRVQQRSFFRMRRRTLLGALRSRVPYWRRSVESFSIYSRGGGTTTTETHIPGSNHWQGLSRYLNDDDDGDKLRWSSVEYAAVHTILDSPEAVLTIFWDVPGKVTAKHAALFSSPDVDRSNNINGATPPAWAININVGGGIINYGPWADRHRAELQRIFNPTLSKDATPAKKLYVGADRVPTQFKFYLELDKELILRVPTREDSKNWRWRKEAAGLRQVRKQEQRRGKSADQEKPATTTAQQRPYGWLDIKVAPNATVSYCMDMVAGPAGYSSTLNIELPSTEVTTSVNHGVLWRSGSQRISCDMSAPLKWNSLRNWQFDIDGDDLELFILRDHIFLFVDLIDDWGSGPPQEYLLFVPFKYLMNFRFRNLKMFLNVNDVNIVNNPTELEENTYLVLSSALLKADTCISLDTFRPSRSAVPFNVQTDVLDLTLHLPTWNTQATFLTSKDLGHLESLLLDGKYHYNSTTSPANTDTLVLNVSGQSPVATIHGFLIRYLLQLKDNYFGDYVHFKTLDEYQDMLRHKANNPEAEAGSQPPHKKSNDLDVMLSVRIDDPKLLLPANLYSGKHHVTIEGAGLGADLRFTNYYMDLDATVSPLSLSLGSDEDGAISPTSATSSTQMYIDGLGIYGHRLFGLPPTEPTYMCNWDLSVGAVTGECTTEFLMALIGGGKAFGFSLDDDENALITFSSTVMHDVTFLRVFVRSVQLWLHVEEVAFLLSAGQINVNYNDWARTHYSKRANIKIPDLQVACVNSESAARHKSRLHTSVETDALFKTTVHFAFIGRNAEFAERRRVQQELIRREDQRTHRTQFLLLPGVLGPFVPDPVDEPAQSVPTVPQPVYSDHEHDKRSISSLGSRRPRPLRQKSSFLTRSTDSGGSIVRPGSIRSSWHDTRTEQRTPSFNHQQQIPDVRLGHQRREFSVSTGRHSAFYSAHGDFNDRRDVPHNTVAFSSQFFAPYFPLENLRPEMREAIMQSTELDDGDTFSSTQFGLDDLDPELLSEGSAYTGLLVELPAGITASLNATSLRHIASLLGALQPTEPEDIIDTLQVDAMTNIFDAQKKSTMKGVINDIILRVPRANLRFLNCSDLDAPDPCQDELDQYDFSLTNLALAARTESVSAVPGEIPSRPRASFNVRLTSAEVSAAERFVDTQETHAAFKANLDNVVMSLGSRDITYIDGDIGAFRATTRSGNVNYLAGLIQRTNILATEMGPLFSHTLSRGDERLKYFTYRLMTEAHAISDPSFIARPSAVLRAATEHLRIHDSWKLISRLRQVWTTLNNDTKERLRLECLALDTACPGDARLKVVQAFQSWRSWDLEDIDNSELMNNIFGARAKADQHGQAELPLMAVLRLQEVAFVLDPGPKQNQIYALDISLRLDSKVVDLEEMKEVTGRVRGPLTVVNAYCSRAGIHLNWELLELAEDVLQAYTRANSSAAKEAQEQEINANTEEPADIEQPGSFHLVVALERGSIVLESVNLRSDTESEDLKISVLMAKRPGASDTNAIFACDNVTTKLRSHHTQLATFRLQEPSVFLSHELQLVNQTSVHTIKTTASSQDLRLVIKQDPIVLSEVLDTVVKDEVAQLYQLKRQFPASPEAEPRKQKISERLSSYRVNLAMFLNTYTITMPLLRSITYTIKGVVARAAMAANFGKEIIFDFDIKENSHDIQIKVKDEPRSISLLQIPPTNGRITNQMGQGENTLTVFASVELVHLDASAVHSLLTALNRPEMSNAINELQQQAKVIQEHVEEIFGPSDVVPKSPSGLDDGKLIYAVHTTLAGIEIFGHAPIKSDTEPMAHLSFSLASIRLEFANRLEPRGPVLENPEVHINLRRILFDIQKGASEDSMRTCGNLSFGARVTATTTDMEDGTEQRSFDFSSDGLEVNLSADTVSTFVDVVGYMGDKIKDLDTTKEIEYLQKRLRQTRPRITINDQDEDDNNSDILDSFFSSIMYSFAISSIKLCWLVAPDMGYGAGQEDLVLSFRRIEFATRKKKTARLTIENFQLQMVPPGQDKVQRSLNSALLPEVIFNVAYVSTMNSRRLAFQAIGKSLDLRLTSGFIVPAARLKDSISLSVKNVQLASANWTPIVATEKQAGEAVGARQGSIFGSKRLESCLVDADFAGAVVHLSGKKYGEDQAGSVNPWVSRPAVAGKYGQFSTGDSSSSTVLRSPGLAWKTEYRDSGKEDPAFHGEIKVDASRNILYPSVVPLIMEITSSIQEAVSAHGNDPSTPTTPASLGGLASKGKPAEKPAGKPGEENILTADPSAVLGRTKLNLGLRICEQEFTLSCQPIARVAASACFDDIYITANTVHSTDHGNFFAISGTVSKLQASVQHVYSREHTGRFEVDSIVLSLMNSKHVSGTNGVSAILKVSPMKVDINAKQLQDFLLFREIWMPREIREASAPPPVTTSLAVPSQGHLVQRYQQVAATGAFPWTATISFTALDVNVDLGQSLGKAVFAISDFWISSKKTSDWEQNLCLGFQSIGIECNGRLSGFVTLQNFKLRTSIEWPEREAALNETPRVQASIEFSQFRLKAAFDYQAFLVADITSMGFLMYNVRQQKAGSRDRLVAIFDGDTVQVFGLTTSAASGVAVWQAVQKLIQERKANYESSLRDIEKFLRRKSLSAPGAAHHRSPSKTASDLALSKSPISLGTDVVVTLKALNLGVYPNAFSDGQVFKLEAQDAQARFAAGMQQRRIHSILHLSLGQLRIGLAAVRRMSAPKPASELSIEDVVASTTGSRGGTILKVPKVEASMQTWQSPESRVIDYIFKSAFEGKVEVGWNYSRISIIRGMWAKHSQALADTWGRALPEMSAIKVTGVPEPSTQSGDEKDSTKEKEKQTKITAEVNVPQSKYEYVPLEPPIIETPQLKDMGEATPPLEWIGLNRDRLPNLTHQIVIVSLLELAGEVEDAYESILGSS